MKEEIEIIKELTNELNFFRQFLEEPKLTYKDFEKKVELIKDAGKSADEIKALLNEIDLKSNAIAEAIRKLQHLKVDASAITGKVGEELEKILSERYEEISKTLLENTQALKNEIVEYNKQSLERLYEYNKHIENIYTNIESSLNKAELVNKIEIFKKSWIVIGFFMGFFTGAGLIAIIFLFMKQ